VSYRVTAVSLDCACGLGQGKRERLMAECELRFVQRQAGGPKVLQMKVPSGWINPTRGGDILVWKDIPLVEEWRTSGVPKPEAE
jgi:hypothetical protein